MVQRMIGNFFKLVGKAIRFSIHRPIQRFNIYSRAKKYLGEDAKYFMPAPRAIGSLAKQNSSQYPHLEGPSGFKSVNQRRLEAIQRRNERLLLEEKQDGGATTGELTAEAHGANRALKSFSATRRDDAAVIDASNKLPVIKTVTIVENPKANERTPDGELVPRPPRPLPTSTNLQLSDPAVIWQVAKVPPGRLDLNKLQELMINKLADDAYWTPKQISETYNIKEEYAANIIYYLKQIRIVLSPNLANKLDYVCREDPLYQSYKDTIYLVDPSLRTENDRKYDETFLPTDELEPEVRRVLEGGARALQRTPDRQVTSLFRRPEPLRIEAINRSAQASQIDESARKRRRFPALLEEGPQKGGAKLEAGEKSATSPTKDTPP